MARYQTGISIDEAVYAQGKQFADAQRPTWTFSDLVQIAIAEYLALKDQKPETPHLQNTTQPTAN